MTACDDARAMFSALLDGESTDAEAAALEAHLESCEPCRREARRGALVDRLALEIAVEDRRATTSSTALLRVARAPRTTGRRPASGPIRRWILGLSLAAAGLLLGLVAALLLRPEEPAPLTFVAPPGRTEPSAEPAPEPVIAPRAVAPAAPPPPAETAPAPAVQPPAVVEVPAPVPVLDAAPPALPASRSAPAPTVAGVATLDLSEGEAEVLSGNAPAPARSGQPLAAGQGVHTLGTKSRAVVRFADGSSVEMRGETVVEDLASELRPVLLSRGSIVATAAARPLSIATPHAQARAREAQLALSVTDEGTQLRVQKGRASWTRRADGASFEVAAGAAPVWALAQDPKKVDPALVEAAIKKGIAYLKQTGGAEGRVLELVLWTYLHAGLTEEESHVKVPLEKMVAAPLSKTYNVALQAMILEKVHRVKHQVRIYHCGQFLADNLWDYGQWGYGSPATLGDPPKGVPSVDRPKTATSGRKGGALDFDDRSVRMKLPVTRNANHNPGSRGDDSNSQYGLLGLRACHDAGIVFPAEMLARADKWWRDSQTGGGAKAKDARPDVASGAMGQYEPAGWGYFAEGKAGKGATGSMTVGGMGALSILDYIQGKNWKADADVLEALNWVTVNFSVTENPGRGATHHYYYLYGLERAGVLYGTERFGPHEWYPLGANYLLQNQQADGSWAGGGKGDGPIDTCFAILFLKRATRPLQDVASIDGRRPVPNK
jgi:ferric-dicitrate binding protein FerR (iron transport regulator)